MTVLLLLAVVVLVLLNGFFVAAEFALVRMRRSRVEEEVEDGVKGAKLVLSQLDVQRSSGVAPHSADATPLAVRVVVHETSGDVTLTRRR